MNTLANQPAFPLPSESNFGEITREAQPGMTLRQYYAGKALQGLLAHQGDRVSQDHIAHLAVIEADALIAELEKTK